MRLGWRDWRTNLRSRSLLLTLLLEDHGRPALVLSNVLANGLREHLHPGLFLFPTVGVKVNDLTVSEPYAEALFNEHIALLILGEPGLAPTTGLGCGWLLESALVIHELRSFG